MINLFEHLREFLFSKEMECDTESAHYDDLEELESCHSPSFECQKKDEPFIDDAEVFKDESFSTNENGAVLNQEDIVVDKVAPSHNSDDVSESGKDSAMRFELISQLSKDVVAVIEEFDSYICRIENEDAKELITLFQYRLIEALVKAGLERIKNDTAYNCLRHTPIPFAVVPDGTPIKEIKRCGISSGNRVLLKAQVVV